MCGYLRWFCGYLRPVLRVCFHMCPRNRLHEKREAAAIAKNARIQICARSPEKRPTSKFLLRNTQGAQIYVTNEGPGSHGSFQGQRAASKRAVSNPRNRENPRPWLLSARCSDMSTQEAGSRPAGNESLPKSLGSMKVNSRGTFRFHSFQGSESF